MYHSTINRVVLIGRLTRDPELRQLPSGSSVCALRLACNASRRDSDGEYQERANYFDVSVFGPRGESVERYMRKGRRIAVDGHLEWREWETADEERRQAVEVIADAVLFLDGSSTPVAQDGESADGESLGGLLDEDNDGQKAELVP